MKLRAYLPAAEPLDEGLPLAWVLFDARGVALREDTTVLSDIPRAEEVELILPATRVLFARLKLPRVNASTIRELLPFAVEDRLLADPAQIHAVAGSTNELGETLVAVVDRAWLEAAVRLFASHGLRPSHGYSESALLAGGKADWHAVLRGDHGFLVDDEGVAVSFDRSAGGELPLALRVAVDEANERGDRPREIRLHADGDARLPDLQRWSEQASVTFTAGSRWSELAKEPAPRNALDLLRDVAMPSGSRASRLVPRAALVLVAIIAFLQLAFTAVDAWRLQRTHDALVARQEAVFRTAFPEAKVIVDPELQLARNLADLKRSRGLAAEDDFLAQATRAAKEFPAGAKSLAYANGRLEARP
ncbi:hypothetical protein BWI17_12415 [Betaproteobacteria bacterium GR16-43]|nr:hypothetical protein BWI17_12415 [Betaproteobacteria bacterium GR16-43]